MMADTGERVSHIVLMGIGEPLDNFDNVMDFINHLLPAGREHRHAQHQPFHLRPCAHDGKAGAEKAGPDAFGKPARPTNEMRSSMMPVNDAYPLEKLIPACRAYQRATGRRISF